MTDREFRLLWKMMDAGTPVTDVRVAFQERRVTLDEKPVNPNLVRGMVEKGWLAGKFVGHALPTDRIEYRLTAEGKRVTEAEEGSRAVVKAREEKARRAGSRR